MHSTNITAVAILRYPIVSCYVIVSDIAISVLQKVR